MSFTIAIDGPAGAGKSTIAKKAAKKLDFLYMDTGAMYRAMALYLIRNNIYENNEKDIKKACEKADIRIAYEDGVQQIYLNGENVNTFIRTEEVGNMASKSSVNRDIRLKLVELQRKTAAQENVIMDGRDIGSYVLPNADLKIFLTADIKVRVQRRYEEILNKGLKCNPEEIEKDLKERDERDRNREFAPLIQAEDAVLINTSYMTIDEVVEEIIRLART